jgi:hypothetical protein
MSSGPRRRAGLSGLRSSILGAVWRGTKRSDRRLRRGWLEVAMDAERFREARRDRDAAKLELERLALVERLEREEASRLEKLLRIDEAINRLAEIAQMRAEGERLLARVENLDRFGLLASNALEVRHRTGAALAVRSCSKLDRTSSLS